MERFVCIHGHFYQPPRENPWLEVVDQQDSARPFHDWNERITTECYAPNSVSRILDGEGKIIDVINNYSRISFNVGPTLLSWLESHQAEVYEAVLEADRLSQERFGGHGSAMAQCYNHIIMPLANRRDKITQVAWGMEDFRHRFRRATEGMWLPETAADLETLDIMAEHGIRFVLLAPNQAARFRRLDGGDWQDVSGGRIDPTRAYLIRLASGREIAAFFYDGPISQAVAFERLLNSGETLVNRLFTAFNDSRDWPQLAHIATDGESYGHHHRFGDMALAYALHHIETTGAARLTNYGEFLALHPPAHEVAILENTSWSCAHGVERWRSDCGCNSGGRFGWNQKWRTPLREAMDMLRDGVAERFQSEAGRLLPDPWAARDQYIRVILDRSPGSVNEFLHRHAGRRLTAPERVRALKLLELQRAAQLMYTSCGWFFDEISGIETVQVLRYAGRALELATELFGNGLHEPFLQRLADAKSNLPEHQSGRVVFEKFVDPAAVGWREAAAHYAVSSLFIEYPESVEIGCYTFDRLDYRRLPGAHRFRLAQRRDASGRSKLFDRPDYRPEQAARAKMSVGRVAITSSLTHETATFSFGVIQLGHHDVSCGVIAGDGAEGYAAMQAESLDLFERGDLAGAVFALRHYFGDSPYSLKSLFRDEQRQVLDAILEPTIEEAEGAYRRIYEQYEPLMRIHREIGQQMPEALRAAAEIVLNSGLRRAFARDDLDLDRIWGLLEEARLLGVDLDEELLGYTLTGTLDRLAAQWSETPFDTDAVDAVHTAAALVHGLPFQVNLWRVQNALWAVQEEHLDRFREAAAAGDRAAAQWAPRLQAIAGLLGIKLHP